MKNLFKLPNINQRLISFIYYIHLKVLFTYLSRKIHFLIPKFSLKHIKIKMCAEKSLSKSQQQQVIFRKKNCCYIKMVWLYKSTGHEERGSESGAEEKKQGGE